MSLPLNATDKRVAAISPLTMIPWTFPLTLFLLTIY
jgi:hypothetical protein